jgi:long-subunit fatty acid transport protein
MSFKPYTLSSFLLLLVSLNTSAEGFYASAGLGRTEIKSELETESSNGFKISGGYELNEYFAIEVSYLDFGNHDLKSSETEGFEALARFEIFFDLVELGLPLELADFISQSTEINVSADIEPKGYDISLIGIAPINDSFELYGKLGWFNWEADFNITTVTFNNVINGEPQTTNTSTSIDGDDMSFGAGATYSVNDSFSLFGEWTRYQTEDADNDFIGFGARFYF